MSGFGAKTQRKILDGIAFVHGSVGRARQPEAFRAAERLIGFLEGLPPVETVKLAGELRRRLETVSGVDVVVATEQCDAVLEAFLAEKGKNALECACLIANKGVVAPGCCASSMIADLNITPTRLPLPPSRIGWSERRVVSLSCRMPSVS